MKIKLSFLGLLIFLTSNSVQAQKQRPFFVLDTLDFNSNKVILYSNNTWAYYKPLKDTLVFADTSTIYTKYWNKEQIYSYFGEKGFSPYEYKLRFEDTLETPHVPVYGRIFGVFTGRHQGVDIELKKGQPVVAAYDGRVRYSQYNKGGYGNLVIIRHRNGLETYYAHLSRRLVFSDQDVKAGDVIGYGGSTGRSYAFHLHFETRYHDVAINPFDFIDFTKSSSDSITKYTSANYNNNLNNTKINNQTLSNNNITANNSKIYTNSTLDKKSSANPLYNSGVRGNNNVFNNKATAPKYYTVKKGDTLYNIARKNNTSVKKICEMNKMTEKATLKIGAKLKVN